VPVQGCTLPYSRAIPLLPLWAVRTVQSLSACTMVHFTFLTIFLDDITIFIKKLQNSVHILHGDTNNHSRERDKSLKKLIL